MSTPAGRPLRVGIHADPVNHKIPGGVGVYVRRLLEQLVQSKEISVHPLAAKPLDADPAQWWKPGWSSPGPAGSVLPLKVLYAGWNYLGMPRITTPLDLIHATGLVIPPGRARLVATIHDVGVDLMPGTVPRAWRRIYAKGLHLALSRAEVLCAVSQAVKQQLVDSYSIEPDRIFVTPEAPNITPADYRDLPWLEGMGLTGRYILNVGTVEPRKNQIALLEAFAEAQPGLEDTRLVIAGAPGWGSAQTLKRVEQLNLSGKVQLTGSIGASALAALYSRAWLFAMPSVYEGFGIPLVEAMGFGIPCVASKDPALREVGGAAAVYVDAAETGAWAEELVRLSLDERARAGLAAAGPARASEFSWQKTAECTIAAYRKAAA